MHHFTYTGAVPAHTQIYASAKRIHEVQKAAIRAVVKGRKVWVGTDEWTSDAGEAIANIVMGCNGVNFVVDSVKVPCQGISVRFCLVFPHPHCNRTQPRR